MGQWFTNWMLRYIIITIQILYESYDKKIILQYTTDITDRGGLAKIRIYCIHPTTFDQENDHVLGNDDPNSPAVQGNNNYSFYLPSNFKKYNHILVK